MSAMLWKVAEPEQLRKHVIEGDIRFQNAMKREMQVMAMERALSQRRSGVPARKPRDVIRVYFPKPEPEMPMSMPQQIIHEVSEKHGIKISQMKGQGRTREVTAARHEAMYRMSTETNMSGTAIGRWFGGRDHSTVFNAVEKFKRKLSEGLIPSVTPPAKAGTIEEERGTQI